MGSSTLACKRCFRYSKSSFMVIRLTAANEGRAIVVIDESPRARYGVLSMGLNLMGVRACLRGIRARDNYLRIYFLNHISSNV
jgi:hypothetical protein